MKSTKRDWLHFITGFATAIIFTCAFNSACKGASPRDIVTTTLILEAGGEYETGAMEAVHEVIHNRSVKRKMTMPDVCLQRWQFSCWNGKDVDENVAKAMKHPRWNEAMKIVDTAKMTNFTNGADHYYAKYIREPYWTSSLTRTTTIGQHIFYK